MGVRSAYARRQDRLKPRNLIRAVPRVKGASFLFTLLAVIGSLHALSMLTVESYRALHSSREIRRLSQDVMVLQDDIVALSAITEHADDELYLDQLARCYGFAYPDERRFVTLVEVLDQPATATLLCK